MTDKIQFDYRKLRGRIVEVFGSISNFCDATGKNRAGVTAKLASGGSMRQEEIIQFADALGIQDNEYQGYFFTKRVEKS